ncbi:MAG: hypothetical protein H7269_03110, partial [Cellulomonas sp.]|nr:hypothetical protein [Cellulomonas sp.]
MPLRQFSVVGDQVLTARAWTRPAKTSGTTATSLPVPAFPLVDGFVELAGAGTLKVDTTTTVRLRDSNGRGGVTAEDLQFGSSEDLFTVASAPAADAVQANLTLTTDLLSTARGSISVTPPVRPSAASYGSVKVTRDAALDRIGSLTRPQAFVAFAQYASAVVAAETAVDADLPLLQARVTDLYSPGKRLLDVVTRQAAARVVCGAAPTSPPSGAARPGQVRYCQAVSEGTAPDAGSVRWTAADGATLTGGTVDATVGVAPSSHVALSGGGGFPRVTVTWTVAGQRRTASTLLTSVQDLGRVLREEGFSGTPVYDPQSEAFELPISEKLTARRTVVVPTGGATSLTPLTGLAGLCPADPTTTASGPRRCARPADPAPGTTGTLGVADSAFTSTLGIALPRGTSDTAAAVAYVRPGTDGQLWKVGDVSATVDQARLSGRIGFLAVDVDVTAYSLATGAGGAVRITLATRSLALPSGRTVGGVTAPNDLLGVSGGAPVVKPVGARGLTATATLAVRDGADAAGARPLEAAGTISATYSDLSDGVLPAVTTDEGYAKLRRLDLRPSVRGVAATGSQADVLVAPAGDGIDFVRDFGIDLAATPTGADPAPQTVQKNLYDLDAAERGLCSAFRVLSATSVKCVAGPMADRVGVPRTGTSPGVPVVSFVPGHRFLIDGDPTALRDVLLDQLAEVLAVYSTPDPVLGLDRTLPLLDVRPEQLDVARIALGDALGTLTDAAGKDDGVTTATSSGPEVSTLQGFGTALRRELPAGAVATLDLVGEQLRLVTDVTAADPAARGQLRVATGNTLLRVVGAAGADGVPAGVAVPLDATSGARVELAVDLEAGTALVGSGTAVTEQVSGVRSTPAALVDLLDGKTAEQGDVSTTVVGDGRATTGAAVLDIGVRVRTAPVAGTPQWQEINALRGSLQSVRSAVGTPVCGDVVLPAGAAACLRLPLAAATADAAPDVVTVSLGANDTSGGAGGAVVRPLAYRFLADPLPALSRTLRDALDGGITG